MPMRCPKPRARARSAASAAAGMLAMNVVDEMAPAAKPAAMASLTPAEWPKSSAFTMTGASMDRVYRMAAAAQEDCTVVAKR